MEWKLAAQRTHTMAEERAFLLPVVIDATRDAEGKVTHVGIFAAVPYCIDLIGGPYAETNEVVIKVFRPKTAIRSK